MFDADSLEKRFENKLSQNFSTDRLTNWLQDKASANEIVAVGHRLVHGGPKYWKSCRLNAQVMAELRELTPFDPEHLPIELDLIEKLRAALPGASQIASFDTAFHHDLPTMARLLPIPRRYEAAGVWRYGFHGLSYSFLMDELGRVAGEEAKNGRIILAHLGSGASLAAVSHGQPIDTSMGLTPAGGIPMSSRSGDLDPGLFLYLNRTEGLNAEQFNQMINSESGLLGLSQISPDMKKLLEIESENTKAADAVAVFCYQVKKLIGAYTAALGGLDTLVFSGGMGENAPKIRERVCRGLEFLAIEIDNGKNEANAEVISTESSKVTVRVMHTDEAVTIAREVVKLMHEEN